MAASTKPAARTRHCARPSATSSPDNTAAFQREHLQCRRWEGDDIILVFVNLRDGVVDPETYAIPAAVPLQAGATYQFVNLVADDPNQTLWRIRAVARTFSETASTSGSTSRMKCNTCF